jgi:hypothetical protein
MGIVGFELCVAQYGANEGGEGKLSEHRGCVLLFGGGHLVFWDRVLLHVQCPSLTFGKCPSLTFGKCPSLTFVIFIRLIFLYQIYSVHSDLKTLARLDSH